MSYFVARKVNMFTTAKGTDIPVLEALANLITIPQCADFIASRHKADDEVPPDTYFIVEED